MNSNSEQSKRRWVTGICWAIAGIFLFWALFRITGLEGGLFPVVQLVAFTPYVLGLSLLAVLPLLLLRRWLPAAMLGVAVIALAAMVLPRTLGGPEEMPGGQPVRVLTSNLAKGNADSAWVLELAEARGADLVFMQEVSAPKVRELERAGFASSYPHKVIEVTPRNGGGAIWSRWPLTKLPPLMTDRQPRAIVKVPGGSDLEVVSVHPTAPIKPGTTRDWDRDYRAMPPAFSGEVPLVLAGDFNATLDHKNLRGLIGTGYRDAGDVTGKGFIPTWPVHPKRSLPVTIDHVLAEEGIAFSNYAVERIRGSDHRAVFAELLVPPASQARRGSGPSPHQSAKVITASRVPSQ